MAGVNPALTQSLLEHVKDLRTQGISVVFVEHDMDVVRDISDWVVVMAEGSIIAEGSHDAITSNSAVIDAYLGAHHDADLDIEAGLDRPPDSPPAAEPGLPAAPETKPEPGTPGDAGPPDATDAPPEEPAGGPV
jgi:branched-chain amino acid transport system ATP-binding protein